MIDINMIHQYYMNTSGREGLIRDLLGCFFWESKQFHTGALSSFHINGWAWFVGPWNPAYPQWNCTNSSGSFTKALALYHFSLSCITKTLNSKETAHRVFDQENISLSERSCWPLHDIDIVALDKGVRTPTTSHLASWIAALELFMIGIHYAYCQRLKVTQMDRCPVSAWQAHPMHPSLVNETLAG